MPAACPHKLPRPARPVSDIPTDHLANLGNLS
jgi:hypothetical protein